MRTLRRSAAVFLLTALGACAPAADPGPDAARLAVELVIPAPEYRGYALDTTAELAKLTPRQLVVMICEDVTGFTDVPCNRKEPASYNALKTFNIEGLSEGTETLKAPPGTKQVIFAQGLNNDIVTYQGYVTMPVILPRGVYPVTLVMTQTDFAELPPPAAPVITQPSGERAEIAFVDTSPADGVADQTTYEFKGTRESGTFLRVRADAGFLGSPRRDFSGNDNPSLYTETDDGNTVTWSLKVPITSSMQRGKRYVFTFDVARNGRNDYSPEVTRYLSLCTSGFCPQ